MVKVSSFNEKTLEKMRGCTKFEFPICLNQASTKMFGEDGKRRINAIVMNETFENPEIQSPKDIWDLYDKYVERLGNILGDDVGQVVEFEVLKEIESLSCSACPVHQVILDRRNDGLKIQEPQKITESSRRFQSVNQV